MSQVFIAIESLDEFIEKPFNLPFLPREGDPVRLEEFGEDRMAGWEMKLTADVDYVLFNTSKGRITIVITEIFDVEQNFPGLRAQHLIARGWRKCTGGY